MENMLRGCFETWMVKRRVGHPDWWKRGSKASGHERRCHQRCLVGDGQGPAQDFMSSAAIQI